MHFTVVLAYNYLTVF